MITIELSIALVVLFVSGYMAWNREFAKTQDKWPRLGFSQRSKIAESLQPFNQDFNLYVRVNNSEDCYGLGVDLCDAVSLATKGAFQPSPEKHEAVQAGLLIGVHSVDDPRAKALQRALHKAGIKAELAGGYHAFDLYIGARAD